MFNKLIDFLELILKDSIKGLVSSRLFSTIICKFSNLLSGLFYTFYDDSPSKVWDGAPIFWESKLRS